MHPEPTLRDVFQAIQSTNERIDLFGHTTSKRFDEVDQKFEEMIEAINLLSDKTDQRFTVIEETMMTKGYLKEYLDERLTDLTDDLLVVIRKEDRKLGALAQELVRRNVLDQPAADRIMSRAPFSHPF